MYKYGRFSVVAPAFYDHVLRHCVRFLYPGPAGRSWTKGRLRSLWTERSEGIVRIKKKQHLRWQKFQVTFWWPSVRHPALVILGRSWKRR